MRASIPRSQFFQTVFLTGCFLCLLAVPAMSQQPPPRSPSETVREFYKTLRERKFREAFSLSIYKAAIDPLKSEEFEDLRPDFEKMALAVGERIPAKMEIMGEQISGDLATVFVKVLDSDGKEKMEPAGLIMIDGAWILGDRENLEIVKKAGKKFFQCAHRCASQRCPGHAHTNFTGPVTLQSATQWSVC